MDALEEIDGVDAPEVELAEGRIPGLAVDDGVEPFVDALAASCSTRCFNKCSCRVFQ